MHVGIDTVALAGEGFDVAGAQGRPRARRRSAAELRSRAAGTQGAEPHDAHHRHEWRALPDLGAPALDRARDGRRRAVRARGNRGARARPRSACAAGAPVVSEAVVVTHAHGIHARPAALIARLAKSSAVRARDPRARPRGRSAQRRRADVAGRTRRRRSRHHRFRAGARPPGIAEHRQAHSQSRPTKRRARSRRGRGPAPAPVEPGTLRGVDREPRPGGGPGVLSTCRRRSRSSRRARASAREHAALRPRARRGARAPRAAGRHGVHRPCATSWRRTWNCSTTRSCIDSRARRDRAPARARVSPGAPALRASAARACRPPAMRASPSASTTCAISSARCCCELDRRRTASVIDDSARRHPAGARSHALAADRHRHRQARRHRARGRRPDLARRDPRGHAGHSHAGRSWARRCSMPRPARAVILDAEAGRVRSRADARRTRTPRARALAQRQAATRRASWPPRKPIASSPAANASRCSPISPAPSPMRSSRWRRAPKAAACCAPSSCSSSAPPRPTKREQLRELPAGGATCSAARPLVIRTLDIGGDKPIPYLPLPPEDNPALGLRGIRTSLWRPDLLEVQLRALLACARPAQCASCCP